MKNIRHFIGDTLYRDFRPGPERDAKPVYEKGRPIAIEHDHGKADARVNTLFRAFVLPKTGRLPSDIANAFERESDN